VPAEGRGALMVPTCQPPHWAQLSPSIPPWHPAGWKVQGDGNASGMG